MAFTLTTDHFSTKEEALAEIAERGWCAIELDVPADEETLHWHEFDTVIFVLAGTARAAFEGGSVMECGAGARIEAPARVVHRATSPAYQAIFGFSIDPADMTQPVNKPVEDPPVAR